MVTVCAWCERFLGPETASISHGICPGCSARQGWHDSPVLVVAAHRQGLIPALRHLLQGSPEVHIVLDRRQGPRRRGASSGRDLERRSGGDRRRRGDLFLA